MNFKFKEKIKPLFLIFKKIKISYWFLSVSVGIAFLASVMEGASIVMMAKFMKGCIQQNFEFIRTEAWFTKIISLSGVSEIMPQRFLFMSVLAGLLFFSLGKNIFSYVSACAWSYENSRFVHRVRTELYARYLSFGKGFFDHNNLGDASQILIGYTQNVQNFLNTLWGGVLAICMIVIYLVTMINISWRLTLLMLVILPIIQVFNVYVIRKIKRNSYHFARLRTKSSSLMQNSLTCIPLIKAYDCEQIELGNYRNLSDQVRQVQFSMDKKMKLMMPYQEVMSIFVFVFIAIVTSYLMIKKGLGTPAIYFVFLYVMKRLSNSVNALGSLASEFASMSGQMQAIANIFIDENKYFVPSGNTPFKGLIKSIKIVDLNFAYSSSQVTLENVNLEIPKGKVTAIVGYSGSGKSTLVQLLMRYYDCPGKSIFIDEVDIRDLDVASYRKRIAVVSQESHLFNDTIKNNLLYGFKQGAVSETQLNNVLQQARLKDLISKAPQGLDTIIGDRGVQLSGGEQQRISIARAILKNPDILFLDEPTSALDSETEKLIQEALDLLLVGKTIVVVAHRLKTVQNADQIIVLEAGKVVEAGPPAELILEQGHFYELWKNQSLV